MGLILTGVVNMIELAKYMLIARELKHSEYEAMKAKLKEALHDWLTYTPGETERYYAYYPAKRNHRSPFSLWISDSCLSPNGQSPNGLSHMPQC